MSMVLPRGGGNGTMPMTVDIFESQTSVQVRWPGLSEAERLEKALSVYSISTNASIHWFDESGHPLMKPHPDNNRPHEQHIKKLIKKCQKFGVRPEIRGQPWAVMSDNNKPPYLMVSWGSLSRAAYRALQESPENVLLAKSMERPLSGVWSL